MKLSKEFDHRILDGVFRLILLIYGKKSEKYVSKFMQAYLRNSMIVNLTKNRFL